MLICCCFEVDYLVGSLESDSSASDINYNNFRLPDHMYRLKSGLSFHLSSCGSASDSSFRSPGLICSPATYLSISPLSLIQEGHLSYVH